MADSKKPRTGLAQIYICYDEGFSGHLRPSYDSAPATKGELTSMQLQTLRNRICKCVSQYVKKNEKLKRKFELAEEKAK